MEYPAAQRAIEQALTAAREAGLIGANIMGTEFACDIRMVRGQGAYICAKRPRCCGSIEGVPALVSIRPPFPASKVCGAARPRSTRRDAAQPAVDHRARRRGLCRDRLRRSRGTKAISLNTRVARRASTRSAGHHAARDHLRGRVAWPKVTPSRPCRSAVRSAVCCRVAARHAARLRGDGRRRGDRRPRGHRRVLGQGRPHANLARGSCTFAQSSRVASAFLAALAPCAGLSSSTR